MSDWFSLCLFSFFFVLHPFFRRCSLEHSTVCEATNDAFCSGSIINKKKWTSGLCLYKNLSLLLFRRRSESGTFSVFVFFIPFLFIYGLNDGSFTWSHCRLSVFIAITVFLSCCSGFLSYLTDRHDMEVLFFFFAVLEWAVLPVAPLCLDYSPLLLAITYASTQKKDIILIREIGVEQDAELNKNANTQKKSQISFSIPASVVVIAATCMADTFSFDV